MQLPCLCVYLTKLQEIDDRIAKTKEPPELVLTVDVAWIFAVKDAGPALAWAIISSQLSKSMSVAYNKTDQMSDLPKKRR